MRQVSADLVDIVRDFMAAHCTTRQLFARYRSGELRFHELQQLIGDDEGSVLFRLKERCHALFRPRDADSTVSVRRDVLFDLAVGSLFHEAMKFRESFYQREVYGPRVRSLRSESTPEDAAFIAEFEKILATVSERLEEGLQETEILVEQTGKQLRVLLADHPNNDFALRYMIENRELSEDVFDESLDILLAELEGSAAEAFERAGRSYLHSGFYERAEGAIVAAIERGGNSGELDPIAEYSRGMAAYLVGDYDESVARLASWFSARGEKEAELAEIALAAVSKVDQLVDGADRERIAPAAAALADRLGSLEPIANRGADT